MLHGDEQRLVVGGELRPVVDAQLNWREGVGRLIAVRTLRAV